MRESSLFIFPKGSSLRRNLLKLVVQDMPGGKTKKYSTTKTYAEGLEGSEQDFDSSRMLPSSRSATAKEEADEKQAKDYIVTKQKIKNTWWRRCK